MDQGQEYLLERQFKASPDQVWKAWTDPAHVAVWYGPNAETVIHEYDAKPGGRWLNEWIMEKASMYQRNDFIEVDAPNTLVYHMNSSNADWEVAGMMPNWPLSIPHMDGGWAQGFELMDGLLAKL